MSLTRRAVLGTSATGLALFLAGCTGGAPRADGGSGSDGSGGSGSGGGGSDGSDGGGSGSDGDGNGDDLPGSDSGSGDGSGAGGTRPEGTGGPGVTIVSVDDDPDLPVRPSVELTRDAASEDNPPQLRTTLTNTTDAPVRVGEGRAVHFAYVSDEARQLTLLPPHGDYPARAGCWRLTEGIAITEEYQTLDIEPDEPSTRLLDLYGAPTDEDACLPVGEYRFETTISVLSREGEQEASATWGFTVLLE